VATNGEEPWPPAGRFDGRLWGGSHGHWQAGPGDSRRVRIGTRSCAGRAVCQARRCSVTNRPMHPYRSGRQLRSPSEHNRPTQKPVLPRADLKASLGPRVGVHLPFANSTSTSRGDQAASAVNAPGRSGLPGFRQGLGRDAISVVSGDDAIRPFFQGFLVPAHKPKPGTSPMRAVVRGGRQDPPTLQGFMSSAQADPDVPFSFCGARYATNLTKKNPAFAGLLSGRPDLNRGPHRPERCALPGCATPRMDPVSHRGADSRSPARSGEDRPQAAASEPAAIFTGAASVIRASDA